MPAWPLSRPTLIIAIDIYASTLGQVKGTKWVISRIEKVCNSPFLSIALISQ